MVIIYLTDLIERLLRSVTGRCLLLARCLAFIGVFSFSPLFGASVDLGFRNASNFLCHPEKPSSGLLAFSAFDFFAHRLLNYDGLVTNNQIGVVIRVVLPTETQVTRNSQIVGQTCFRIDKKTSFRGHFVESTDLLLGEVKRGIRATADFLSWSDFPTRKMLTRSVLEFFDVHVVGVVERKVPNIEFCLPSGADILKLKVESRRFPSSEWLHQNKLSQNNVRQSFARSIARRVSAFSWSDNISVIAKEKADAQNYEASYSPVETSPIVFISALLPCSNSNREKDASDQQNDSEKENAHSLTLPKTALLLWSSGCFLLGAMVSFVVVAILSGRRFSHN